jgi:hypothetical protein
MLTKCRSLNQQLDVLKQPDPPFGTFGARHILLKHLRDFYSTYLQRVNAKIEPVGTWFTTIFPPEIGEKGRNLLL